jgi:DNA-binding response OmpR family regulator
MKILIVDDDTTARLVLEATLTKLNHEVVAASDGMVAWKILQNQPIQVVLTDWNMPVLDGLELCRRIRTKLPHRNKYTYVILLTVLDGRNYFLKGMEAGADDFITKPYDEQQLAARVRVAERIVQLHTEVAELSGLLPICSYCKSIRNDQNYWERVETYLSERTEAKFTHSICPSCYEKHIKPQLEQIGITAPPKLS